MTLGQFIMVAGTIEAISRATKITFAHIDGCYVYDDKTFDFKVDLNNALEKFNTETLNREIEYARPYSNEGYSCFSIAFKEN